MDFDIMEWVEGLSQKDTDHLVGEINEEGFILDETIVRRIVANNWNNNATNVLINKGLKCKSLGTTAKDCPNLGFIYAIFDAERYNCDEIIEFIDIYCKKNQPKKIN